MRYVLILFSLLFILSCGAGMDSIALNGVCEGYPDYATSNYVLPYPSGDSYTITQGNCSAASHFGDYRFSYDFDTPIGANIAAMRGGTVTKVEESFSDGNGCPDDNHVYIKHSDGTVAAYIHLTKDGALVAVGDTVAQGDIIGKGGNTGCSSGAHLHISLWKTDAEEETIPITFSNTVANPRGLIRGKKYTAE